MSLGLAPLGHVTGLFIATPSYNGKMSFNVVSTREIPHDIEFFMDCLWKSHGEPLALAQPSKAKPKAERKTAGIGRSGKTAEE